MSIPSALAIPINNQAIRRVYTSQNQQLPSQLSYQSIKLANFIELQLTDLWDSLQQINQQNFKNQLKQSLSRSYNVFYEMKKLYTDLGMSFLYLQSKKLIASYGIIFVYLIQKLQKYEKKQSQNKDNKQTICKPIINQFEEKIKKNMQNLKMNKSHKEIRKYKKMGGIHLFNQSYARFIDYDIQYFRQLRDKQKQKYKTEQDIIKSKIQEQRKFKKQIQDELNDYSYLKVDGEQLCMFLNRHKRTNQQISKVSLQEQLQKISVFFKQSQHQAIQFLRKQKNLQSFHQLTQGFNLIVTQCQNTKAIQLFNIKDKIKQVFSYIQLKIKHLLAIIQQKQKEITAIKQSINIKKSISTNNQTQTYFNFDQEIKQLYRKIVTTQIMNQQLKTYIAKTIHQDKKQISNLTQQMSVKQSNIRQMKQNIQQNNNYIAKIQRKFKILDQSNKNKNIKDPVQFFNQLSDEMKKCFVQELKQQGFLISSKNDDRYVQMKRNHLKQQQQSKNFQSLSSGPIKNDYIVPTYQTNIQNVNSQLRKRQSSIFKRPIQQATKLNKQNDTKTNHLYQKERKNVVKSQKISSYQINNQDSYQTNNNENQSQKSKQNENLTQKQRQKQTQIEKHKRKQNLIGFNVKKQLSAKSNSNQNFIQKVRVFDVQQKSAYGYSQKSFQMPKSQKYQAISSEYIGDQKNNQGIFQNKSPTKNINKSNLNDQNRNQNIKRKNLQEKDQKIQKHQQSFNKTNKRYKTYKIQQSSHEEHEQQQKIVQKEKRTRKNKIIQENTQHNSCEENSEFNNSNTSQQQKNNIQKKPLQRYSIINQFNLTIRSTLPHQIQTNERLSRPSLNKNQEYQKQRKSEYYKNNKNSNSPNKQIKQLKNQKIQGKQREILKKTIKKLNNFNQHQQSIHSQKQRQSGLGQTKQKITTNINLSNSKDNNINKSRSINKQDLQLGSITENKSINKSKNDDRMYASTTNTFYKQSSKKKNNNEYNTNLQNNRLQTTLKRNTSQNKQKNLNKNNIKFNPIIRMSQDQATTNYQKMIQQQFGQQQIVSASRIANTVQQFKQHVIKLHKSKCGNNCRHLQRYIEIFTRLRNQNYRSKRQTVKMHIQNINDKINIGRQNEYLPTIYKK